MITYMYRNSMEIPDGRGLSVEFTVKTHPENPHEDEQSEPVYFLDGKPCSWEELPGEISFEIVTKLVDTAQRCEAIDRRKYRN